MHPRHAVVLAFLSLAFPTFAKAQEHAHPAAADSVQAPADTTMAMMAPGPLGIPREREGSGTAWLPDDSPMYAFHGMSGPWELMLHGSASVHYVDDGGDRGDGGLDATNWIMGMARRPAAGGDLMLRAMGSLDPLTTGECGYPDLLATGEFCDGQSLVDRQHPHDLFMELAAVYEREINDDLALQLYTGLAGEPALGPVAYPHRISALANPIAPISHHWLDSTHISFGVVTAGIFGRRWKLEGSAFNGREPDEERFDVNLDAMDSWSGRLWWLPNAQWALQVSHGELNEAEIPPDGGPRVDVTRTTASATYHMPLANEGHWATTAAWGRNEEPDHTTDAFLVETNANLAQQDLLFGRLEVVEKSAEDLALEGDGEEIFRVAKLSLVYIRHLAPFGGLVPGLGAGVSLSFLPDALEDDYGTRTPVGFLIFVRVRPAPGARHEP
ncbi:MAG: hypothetical protein ABR527_01895 [Gemmatimonadota bacterium]